MKTRRVLLVVVANLLLFGSAVLQAALTPLTLNCSSNLVAVATSSNGATVFFSVTASGGCGQPSVTATPPSGSTFPVGTTTVTVTATDTCDHTNFCSFTVTIKPAVSSSLVLTCSSNLTVNATSSGGAIVYFNVMASGGCSPPPFVTAVPPSGSTFPIGTTTVISTASDSCGNTTNCSFTVTVNPPVYPPLVLTCSSNLTVTATSSSGATVFFNITASGGCSPPPLVYAYPPSGSTFPIGTTTVYSTVSDTCGNATNCSFTVTVKPPTYPPLLLTCSSNLTVNATSSSGTIVFFNVMASGGCSPPPFVTALPPSGSTFPIGTTTVYSTASDSCGNTTNCSFTVTVVRPPISLNCSSNLTVTATSSSGATVFFNVTASGGCSPPPFVTAVPPSGSTFPIGITTVYSTASDGCGTSTNCSFTVTVVRPPISLNCSSNLTVIATSSNGAIVYFNVTASGGCSPPPLVTAIPPSGSTFPIGITTVYSTASDSCGTSTNCSFTVTVTPPANLQADLQLTKTVSPGVMNTNGQVQFSINIQNNGPDTATNIVVRDNLPTGLSLVSSNVPAGTVFNAGSGGWSIPFLTNGATAALGLTALSTIAGNYTNVAFIASSGSVDPNLLNNTNSAVAIFVPGPAADLGVLLIPITNTAPVGGTILLQCIITNLGPNSPTNVAAQLTYPPGMAISGVFGPFSNGAFDTNTGVLQAFGALVPGTYEQVNIQFTLTNAGAFTSNFRITSSSLPDPIVGNNSASVTVTGLVSYALSGGMVSCSGSALTNFPVALNSANSTILTTNTGTNGSFTFSSLLPGAYTVMPTNSNYFYNPASMAVTISNRNVTLTNFTALPRFISGTVLQGGTNGTPVAGVTILLGGALSLTNTTDTNGVYVFTNLNAGKYTVTPQTNGFLGMVFAPTNATVMLGSLTNCPVSANFVTTNLIIMLRALEVVQVVQDWSNTVTLIANKATLVRAHLQLYGTNTTPILVDGARLYAQNLAGGSANWAPDNGRITVMTNNCAAPSVRSNITMSLNFTVRNGFNTGQDLFRFSWPNGVVFNAEPADAAGDLASNGQVRASYNPAPQLGVRFIRVAMTNGFMTNITAGVTNISAITNLPTPAQIEEQKRRLISIYPITQVTNLTYGYFFWKATVNPSWDDELALLEGLSAARLTSSDTNGIATNRIWYGVVPQGVRVRGAGYVPGPVAEGNISASPQNYQRHIAAHEIGHALGRPHDILAVFGKGGCGVGGVTGHCGECAPAATADFPMVNVPGLGFMPTLGPLTDDNQVIWGYDTYQGMVISPYYYYDVMSYCMAGTAGVGGFPAGSLGPWPWNSKFTYTELYRTNQTRFGAAVAPALHQGLPVPGAGHGLPKPDGNPSAQAYLLVRGSIDDDSGLVTFAPCYPVASALPVTPGPYTLVELDTNAVPLYALPFTPDVPEAEFDEVSDMNTVDLTVPILPGAAALEVYSNNVPVGELVAETDLPSVQVLNPIAGEQFGDTDILVNWTGSDSEGIPLYYLVQFSPDGGNSWDTLAIDLAQTNLDIPPDSLAATTNGFIRVIASDGFNAYTAPPSGPFTITNHIPAISILQPGSGALFYGDQTIVFEADAFDLEDGPLDGTNVLWVSSLDGPLGSGATLPLETLTLSEGVHLVTATAIANSGLTNSASVQIVVLRLAPPQLSIQLINQEQVQLSWPVSYTNYVLESTANLAPSNWNSVSNVPAVSDLLQSVNVNLSSTNQFFRLRMP